MVFIKKRLFDVWYNSYLAANFTLRWLLPVKPDIDKWKEIKWAFLLVKDILFERNIFIKNMFILKDILFYPKSYFYFRTWRHLRIPAATLQKTKEDKNSVQPVPVAQARTCIREKPLRCRSGKEATSPVIITYGNAGKLIKMSCNSCIKLIEGLFHKPLFMSFRLIKSIIDI